MIKNKVSLEELLNDLKNKIYKPVYFFTGEESYYIDKITDYIMDNVLTENEKAFNQTVIYGKDGDASLVLNAVRRFPMMSNQQLVILKEGQELKNFEDLIYYIENPLKSTILVINYKYKSLDKRKKIYKSIEQNAVIFESEKFYEEKIPNWIATYLSKRNYKIEAKAAVLLTEFLGNDLSKLSNELDKLIITISDNNQVITSQLIEKNIGISKEYNNFELQNALTRKDVLKANRIINYFAGNQKNNHITQTITNLYYFFSKVLVYHNLNDKSRKNVAVALKINPYFAGEYELAAKNISQEKLVQIISLLREYDMKSKGFGNVSASPGDLLKELIFKILH
jgi:DNA polymerase III subunit delta